LNLWIQFKVIRESRDQHAFDHSPELIAVFHALHRLLAPRHPPHALSSLAALTLFCSRFAGVVSDECIVDSETPATDTFTGHCLSTCRQSSLYQAYSLTVDSHSGASHPRGSLTLASRLGSPEWESLSTRNVLYLSQAFVEFILVSKRIAFRRRTTRSEERADTR
jgi:hypothetical protein